MVGGIGIGWCPQPSGQGSSFGFADGLFFCCFVALRMFGARPFPASVRVLARLSRRSAGNSGGESEAGVDLGLGFVLLYFVLFVVVVMGILLFFFVLFFR